MSQGARGRSSLLSIRRLWLGPLVLLTSCMTAAPGGPPAAVEVPIQVIRNIVYVAATVNKGPTALLVVDTGATWTIFTPRLIKRLGLVVPPDAPQRKMRVVGGEVLNVPFIKIATIQVGEVTMDDQEIGVSEIGSGADGLLATGSLGEELCNAIRRLAVGRQSLPAIPLSVAQAIGDLTRQYRDNVHAALVSTEREPTEIAAIQDRLFTMAVQISEKADRIREITRGKGADSVLECAGGPTSMQEALENVKRGGRIGVVAWYTGPVQVDMNLAVRSNVRIYAARGEGGMNCGRSLALMSAGKITADAIITHHFELDQIHEAFQTYVNRIDNALKVAIHI